MPKQERQVQIRDYWMMLRRRSRIIAVTIIVSVLAGGWITFRQAPVYEARARLLVTTPLTPPDSALLQGLTVFAHGRTVETQMQIISSMPLAEKVYARMKHELPRDMNAEKLSESLDISNVKESDVVLVTATAENPVLAQHIVNTFSDVYVNDCMESSKSSAKKAAAFVEDQVNRRKQELNHWEEAIRQFRTRMSYYSADIDTGERYRVRENARGIAQKAEAEAEAASSRLAAIRARMRNEPREIVLSSSETANPEIIRYRGDLSQFENQREALLAQYTPDHPRVKAVDARIAEVKQRLRDQERMVEAGVVRGLNPVYGNMVSQLQQAEADLAAKEREVATWRAAQAKAETEVEKLPEAAETLQRLERSRSAAERSYLMMLERLDEYKVAESTNESTARIVELGAVPEKPIRPRKTLNMIFSLVLGLFLGIGLAALIDSMDDTMKNGEDVQRHLSLTTLGLVPLMDHNRSTVISPSLMGSSLGEAFRMLRSNVAFMAVDSPLRTLVIASTKRGEGKTTVAYNLAVAMAIEGKQVILVDSDLRRPRLHQLVGTQNHQGLTNVLVSTATLDNVLVDSSVPGLQFLPSGPLPPNPAELLGSIRMHEILDQLKARADVVIFDTPPCTAVADGVVLSSIADATLMVVSSTSPNRDTVVYGMELLQKAMARVLGVVLNNVSQTDCGHEFSYLYGASELAGDSSDWLAKVRTKILPPTK